MEEEEDVVKSCRKVKKKSSVQTPEDNGITWDEEDMQKYRSLPSWMFETQEVSRIGEGSSCIQKAVAAIAPRRPSNIRATSFQPRNRIYIDNLVEFLTCPFC